jgi:hypothetical protein
MMFKDYSHAQKIVDVLLKQNNDPINFESL